ncbi:MAG: hypothetical protein P8Z42_06845 [Anaerolineales bacterium]|jgi:uncharacterized RDD family membrane protein YckC
MRKPKDENSKTPNRHYPPFWERFVPFAIAIIGVIIVVLLLISIAVALGLFPG